MTNISASQWFSLHSIALNHLISTPNRSNNHKLAAVMHTPALTFLNEWYHGPFAIINNNGTTITKTTICKNSIPRLKPNISIKSIEVADPSSIIKPAKARPCMRPKTVTTYTSLPCQIGQIKLTADSNMVQAIPTSIGCGDQLIH